MKYSEDELPVTLRLNNVRVRMWQGIPDVTIDNLEQITKLDETPWESIDPENHVIDVDLDELAAGSSRMGISTEGTVVSVRDDCGVIYRCPECRRVLRDDACAIHGSVQGNKDIRLRLVIDNGNVTSSLIISSQATLEWLSLDQATFEENLSLDGQAQFVQQLRNDNLGRRVKVGGRCINDNQGMMIIVDKINTVDVDAELSATEARTKWGVA
jgi:replication factor A1